MIEDRAYQARALADARAAYSQGRRAVLLVAPTGAGKTTIAAMAASGAVSKGKRVTMLAHRRELLDQAVARFRAFSLDVGCNGENIGAPVQVWSPGVILARRQMPECELVIVDEAHHYVADEWGQITTGYLNSGARLMGLSATPERGDGLGLGGCFDHLVVVAQIAELTSLGFLVPCEVVRPRGDVRKLACEPWEAFQRYSDGRSTVVFAPHVKAAESFAADFRERGIEAGVVEGKMADEDRDRILARFASGELRVLVNVMVLTEGWDCPRAAVCMLARTIGSPSLYLQMVGRVLRPHEGKSTALLVDLTGNVGLHGFPDEERIWSLEGAACSRWGSNEPGPRLCRTCHNEIPMGEMVCPVCQQPVPEQVTPAGEGVELEKVIERERKQEARAALPEDSRTRMLATLYAKGLRRGHKRRAAELAYRSMTKRFPDTKLMVNAWKMANEEVAREKGDAWEGAE